MRRKAKPLALAVVVLMAAVMLGGSAPLAWADSPSLKVTVTAPNIYNNVQFNLTIKVENQGSSAMSFNRIAVAYANPDLTVKGPYLVSTVSRTVNAHSYITFTIPFKVTTTQPGGTIIPIMVSLWYNNFNPPGSRGAGVCGAKLSSS